MGSRDVAEAAVVLGRATVDQAIADPAGVDRVVLERAGELRAAIETIKGYLPDRVPEAVAFAAALEPELRMAIAGVWVDGAAVRVLRDGGLVEGEA